MGEAEMIAAHRKQLEEEYGPDFLRKMDEATMRLEAKNSPSAGPTGECPCGGVLVYLLRQQVHYCADCDTEYKNVDASGKPVKEVTIEDTHQKKKE